MIRRDARQAAARLSFQIRGVNHRQPSRPKPGARDVMKQAERRPVEALIAFVIADHRAATV